MNDDEHKICALEKQVAVLDQKSKDDDKALVLAKSVSSALWAAIIALLIGLINIGIALLKH